MRTKWIALILLLGSFALAFLAREQTPSFQKCQAEYEAQAASSQEPKYLPFFIERVFAVQCTAAFFNKYNAAITALATVLLTAVTGGLVWAGYRQIVTTRAQLRAYVFPDTGNLVDGMMLNPPMLEHANEPGVILTWRNTGQTPAIRVINWGQIAVIEPINEHTLVPPRLQDIFFNTLGAGAAASKSLWFGRALTPNEIADVTASARAIYIYGRLEYRDIFGRKRWTNYRFAYSGPFPPPPGVTFAVCVKGNDSDLHHS